MTKPLLALRAIRKSFGSTIALRDVSLEIFPGEVTCILGENGAGKSTLMRIAAGELEPDGGVIEFEGVERRWRRAEALAGKVSFVHQHFLLIRDFTALENLAFAERSLPFWLPEGRRVTAGRAALERSGMLLEAPERKVAALAVGERARLELGKALAVHPRLLILDEPTAVFTAPEIHELARTVRDRAASGVAVVLVTHKLADVFEMADRIVVMRSGSVMRASRRDEVTAAELAESMIGAAGNAAALPGRASDRGSGPPAVRLADVTSEEPSRGSPLRSFSLEVRRGEIAAIVGVAGNGQNAIAELLRGLIGSKGGAIAIDGRPATRSELASRRDVGHIPADRTEEGLVGELSIVENLTLRCRFEGRASAREKVSEVIREFSIRAESPDQVTGSLSGGNQQKVLLARELLAEPLLLVAAEPTRGLDPEATAVVRRKLRDAAERGTAILLMTSDLDEARELASSLHVIYRGSLTRPLDPATDGETIGRLMAGLP